MLTGITMTLFSRKTLSASGVVGPFAPSAMIWTRQNTISHFTQLHQMPSPITRIQMRSSFNLGLDPGGIVTGELLLSGGRNQDVAVSFQNVPFIGFSTWEAHNGAVVLQTHVTNFPFDSNMFKWEAVWLKAGKKERNDKQRNNIKAIVLVPVCNPPVV